MGFPDYKIIKKKWLYFKWEVKEKDGWEDLGQTDFSMIEKVLFHPRCGTTVSLGKENETVFNYCDLCMVKITNNMVE